MSSMGAQTISGLVLLDERTLGETSYTRATDAIRRDIVNGRFKDGDRITTVQLAECYGLSQAPIREALHQLAAEGIVHFQPKRGAVVRSITPTFLEEIYEVKLGLVPYLEGIRASLAQDAHIDLLAKLERSYEAAVHAGDLGAAILLNRQFHQAAREIKPNREADRILSRHDGLIEALRRRHGFSEARYAGTVEEHRQLVEAYSERDPQRAQKVSWNHLLNAYHDMRALLEA